MLTKRDIQWTQDNELEILRGRRTDPGDFYLVKKTLASVDTFDQIKNYSTVNEYHEPTIKIFEGNERECLEEGFMKRGDMLAILDWREDIETDPPSTVGDSYYLKAIYKGTTYRILYNQRDGLGGNVNRQKLYLKKETGA